MATSNLAFRPRPIDINKPLPIIRQEVEDEDVPTGISRSVPKMPTGMDPEDEEEKHIQKAIAASLKPASRTEAEIPTPSVRLVESYFTTKNPGNFARTQAYVKYKGNWLFLLSYHYLPHFTSIAFSLIHVHFIHFITISIFLFFNMGHRSLFTKPLSLYWKLNLLY